MSIKTNDQLMAIYLSSLIRAITAFHDLIENKIQNRQLHDDPIKRDDEKPEEIVNGTQEEDAKMNGVNGDSSAPEEKNGSSGKYSKPKDS
jgi:26S proteasome regulatory subunit N8